MRRGSSGGHTGGSFFDNSQGGGEKESKELILLRLEVKRLRAHVPLCRRMPKLLVLDLNGLLLHRIFINGEGDGALPRVPSSSTVNNFRVYERPHVRDFLRFCLDNFFVGVWTTASSNNAIPLIEGLLPPQDVARLVFIWDGKKCTYNGQTDPLKPGKPIAFKELKRLWESKEVASLFGPENTLLIDDSTYKASLNPDFTAIHPPAWDDPEALANDQELAPTGRIRGYLEAVLLAETTIPEFVRATPYESFVVAAPPVSAIPLSAADLEATFFRTNAIATTPEMDYHRVSSAMAAHEDENGKEKEEQEDDDDDEIVLAPSLANLSLRLA